MMRSISVSAALILFTSVCVAQIESYSYKRPLNKVEKENYYSIQLQPEVIARSKSDLSDIRLFNIRENDTTEVPYLLNWMGSTIKEISVPFELINDTYNQKCCSYVTLKFGKKQTINRIKLNVTEPNFDKSVKVEGSNDGKEWFTIREHLRIVRFQNASEDFSYTTLDFQNTEYIYFRLKFDDDGSPRIHVSEAYAFENQLITGNYDAVKITGKSQKENKKEKISEIIVELPFNYLISHINISSNSKTDFYRNVNIYGSTGTFKTAKGDMESWNMLNTSVLSSEGDNTISCSNFKTKKIKIEVINYDNEPIDISDVKVFSEQCRLVANIPVSDNIYLVYGKENDNAPNYDLVHFKEKIPSSLSYVGYGAEQVKITSVVKASPLIESKNWLWLAMGAVILIIGYFALSMLKKEQSGNSEE
jgi:uncharacterized protein DUF3999/F5/8 type C domain-containing protein